MSGFSFGHVLLKKKSLKYNIIIVLEGKQVIF